MNVLAAGQVAGLVKSLVGSAGLSSADYHGRAPECTAFAGGFANAAT